MASGISHRFLYKIKTQKNLGIQLFKKCSTMTGSNIASDYQRQLDTEKQDEILTVINSSNFKKLKKYILPSEAKSIISERKNGPYKSLDDFVSKVQIEPDILNHFYISIIEHTIEKKKWRKYVTALDIKTIPMPETIVGIHIGPTAITWTLINNESQILDWNCVTWRDEDTKITTHDLINLAPSIVSQLPTANCYVMEEFHAAKKSFRNVITIQQQLTIAVLSCLKLLDQQTTDNSVVKKNTVYMLQPLTSARIFDLVIGNETIATGYVTNQILNRSKEDDKKIDGGFIDEVKIKYTKRSGEEKEQMGWSLLKAVAFVRLLLIFNADAMYEPRSI